MTKEDFLSLAEIYYSEIESLNYSPAFYDYGKSLLGQCKCNRTE